MAGKIGAHEIRRRFLAFFEDREHTIVPSSPLVPHNDPTLLFTNAGMNQFKDVFVGREKRPYARATSSQKCLRAGGKHNDLDNVGFTPRHHTFFEMLGNFSFGNYFKKEAIAWAWELMTGDLGLPADRLVVSIYNGEGEQAPFDQEAFDLWAEIVPRERIYALDSRENFWQMGDTGPCGPCSEIHIFHGDHAPPDAGKPGKGPDVEDDAYTELWNLVFMQYEKHADGSMTSLPKPSIDTGAGLERLAATCAGVRSNYETELLAPLVAKAMDIAGVKEPEDASSFHVIADHARATAFLMADGVLPDREGRAYVLRRIMRRAIRHGTLVGIERPFFHEVCLKVVDEFEQAFPELRKAASTIEEMVRMEEEAFRRTLGRGLRRFEQAVEELPENADAFPVPVAAKLYDTYGFPPDLTRIMAEERDLSLDEDAVKKEIETIQGPGSGLGGAGSAVTDVYFQVAERLDRKHEDFLGYEATEADAKVIAIVVDGAEVEAAPRGTRAEVVFDRTPFYAESGGQVGDRGTAAGGGVELDVTDVGKPTGGIHFHMVKVGAGELRVGQGLHLQVDVSRRDAIRRNHSATHLLHHALRSVLGTHVIQKGSLVAPDKLRFDFSHNRPVSPEQIAEIEAVVNAHVLANADTRTREMALDDAKASGAIGLFGEKYDAQVRVVTIGGDSVELCGGTHVRRAGDIGLMKVVSEGGIAQGVRRIEAVTGRGALDYVQSMAHVIDDVSAGLHASSHAEVLERFAKLQADLKKREREVQDLRRKLATGPAGAEDVVHEIHGVKLLAKKIGVADPKAMRDAADTLRDRLGTGVVVLGGERDGKASLLVAVTKDLAGKRVHAGKLVGAIAPHVDGRGGGRPDLAQAGGPKAAGIEAALAAAEAALGEQLAG